MLPGRKGLSGARVPLETNKCARCVVPAEYFSNVRAFLSTSHVHTAWTLGAHFTHKGARLSRTARAGLDRSHPISATWGHAPRTAYAFSSDRVWTNVKPVVAKRPALNLPSSHDDSVPVTLVGVCALFQDASAYNYTIAIMVMNELSS